MTEPSSGSDDRVAVQLQFAKFLAIFILSSLIVTSVVFLLVAYSSASAPKVASHLSKAAQPEEEAAPSLAQGDPTSWVLTFSAVVLLGMALGIPPQVSRQGVQVLAAKPPGSTVAARNDLAGVWFIELLLTLVLAEGAGLLSLITFAFIDSSNPAPLTVVGAAFVAIVVKFPTLDRLEAWLAQRLRDLDHLRAERRGPIQFS